MNLTHYRQRNKNRNSITWHLQTDIDTHHETSLDWLWTHTTRRLWTDSDWLWTATGNNNNNKTKEEKRRNCTTCPLQIDSDSIQVKKQNNETVTAGVTYRTLRNNQIQQKPANRVKMELLFSAGLTQTCEEIQLSSQLSAAKVIWLCIVTRNSDNRTHCYFMGIFRVFSIGQLLLLKIKYNNKHNKICSQKNKSQCHSKTRRRTGKKLTGTHPDSGNLCCHSNLLDSSADTPPCGESDGCDRRNTVGCRTRTFCRSVGTLHTHTHITQKAATGCMAQGFTTAGARLYASRCWKGCCFWLVDHRVKAHTPVAELLGILKLKGHPRDCCNLIIL